jgi:hypothetical protein
VAADLDARALRVRLLAEMTAAEVPDDDAPKLLSAVGEVLANAHRHGAGARSVRVGRVGDRFVCEVADHTARGSTMRWPATCHHIPATDGPPGSGSPAR